MVIKKSYFIIFLLIVVFFKNSYSSQILDYETEEFIKSLIDKIKFANNIERDINFKIISNENINAFVDENNLIYITSGLIEYSPDYVSLLSVLAHEIGHIEKNHIAIRKMSVGRLKNIKKISNMSIIASSIVSKNPEILKGIAVSEASTSDVFLNFTKDQEIEADYYALETLKKLKINSSSLIELLEIIESKAISRGLDKNKQKLSTHPYFQDRISIIKFVNQNNRFNFNKITNNNFKLIKAKFLGYSNNKPLINKLEGVYKKYSLSILDSKNGDLKNSLKKINFLILNNPNNIYFLETKADILYSFGYTKEANKFYKSVLETIPKNKYIQLRIVANTNFSELSKSDIDKFFSNNINLLEEYYYNKNILLIYLDMAKKNGKNEWENCIKFLLENNMNDKELVFNKLTKYNNTKDKNLKSFINKILNNYK